MEPQEFIKTVLPTNAICAIVGIKKGKPVQTLKPLAEIGQFIQRGLEAEMDVYFGCAGYATQANRTKSNVSSVKSFWVDLDCGTGTAYVEKQDGFNAVRAMCRNGVPKPYVVDSGRGLHLYWILDEDITPAEWTAYASRVVDLATKFGLKIKDRGCSTDIARILRVPQTFNYKDIENPAPVKLVIKGDIIAWGAFKAQLDAETAPVPQAAPRTQVAKYAPDPMTALLAGNVESSFGQIVTGKECAQINWGVENAEHLPNPFWMAILSIIKKCRNGESIAHKFSARDPRYDPKETQELLDRTKGPRTCAKFNEEFPGRCDGCKFAARNKSPDKSPIILGNTIAKATAPAVAKPLEHLNLIQQEPRILPDLPYPYSRGVSGGIYRLGPKNPDGTVGDPEIVYPYNLDVTNRISDPKRGDTLYITLELPHEPVKEILLPATSLHSMDKLKDVVGFHGVFGSKKEWENISHYLIRMAMHIQASKPAESAHLQMGWTEDRSGFVIGRAMYKADGIYRCPSSAESDRVAGAMRQEGTLEEWNSIAERYGEPAYAMNALALLSHMSSVLNHYTGDDPLWTNLVSGKSGSGKTTTMEVACAVWGAPKPLIQTRIDTINAVDKRRTILGSICCVVDEITNRSGEELSTLAYSMSVSREKMRLTQNSVEMFNELYRDADVMSTSNDHVIEKMAIFKTNAAGEMARTLEMMFPDRDETPDAIEHFKSIHRNYGHVGPMLMDWCVKHEKGLAERIRIKRAEVQTRFNGKAAERNWVGKAAAIMVMLDIVKDELGLLKTYNKAFLFEEYLKVLFLARSKVVGYTLEHFDLVSEFINENRLNILMPDANTGLLGATRVEQEVRHRLVGRWEKTNNKLWLAQKDLKDYCNKRQHSYTDLLAFFTDDPHFKGIVSKNLSSGTSMVSGPSKSWLFESVSGELVKYLPPGV